MVKIFVAGDYCPRLRITEMLSQSDYSFFDELKPCIQDSDYSIVNFECPVVEGEVEPIQKCGPALRTQQNAIDSIVYAGFDGVTLANNHFKDFGNAGCEATLRELKSQGVDYVGGGLNLTEAQQILYKEIKGKQIAIVNFCENEFSIATDNEAGAAPMDVVDNYHQIIEARKNADYVLVIVHGGHEYYQLPSPRMKKLYRYYIELGADAVVNHHQHCYSGYEYYCDKPIVYGLGNLCFDSEKERQSIWNEGYCVRLGFDEEITLELIPYIQCGGAPIVRLLQDRADFDLNIVRLNSIIADDAELQRQFDLWIEKQKTYKMNIFASYHNRYLNAAANRNYIPRLITKQEVSALINHICCEAHRDTTIGVLTTLMNKK